MRATSQEMSTHLCTFTPTPLLAMENSFSHSVINLFLIDILAKFEIFSSPVFPSHQLPRNRFVDAPALLKADWLAWLSSIVIGY